MLSLLLSRINYISFIKDRYFTKNSTNNFDESLLRVIIKVSELIVGIKLCNEEPLSSCSATLSPTAASWPTTTSPTSTGSGPALPPPHTRTSHPGSSPRTKSTPPSSSTPSKLPSSLNLHSSKRRASTTSTLPLRLLSPFSTLPTPSQSLRSSLRLIMRLSLCTGRTWGTINRGTTTTTRRTILHDQFVGSGTDSGKLLLGCSNAKNHLRLENPSSFLVTTWRVSKFWIQCHGGRIDIIL